jgi:hypothetical protein
VTAIRSEIVIEQVPPTEMMKLYVKIEDIRPRIPELVYNTIYEIKMHMQEN